MLWRRKRRPGIIDAAIGWFIFEEKRMMFVLETNPSARARIQNQKNQLNIHGYRLTPSECNDRHIKQSPRQISLPWQRLFLPWDQHEATYLDEGDEDWSGSSVEDQVDDNIRDSGSVDKELKCLVDHVECSLHRQTRLRFNDGEKEMDHGLNEIVNFECEVAIIYILTTLLDWFKHWLETPLVW